FRRILFGRVTRAFGRRGRRRRHDRSQGIFSLALSLIASGSTGLGAFCRGRFFGWLLGLGRRRSLDVALGRWRRCRFGFCRRRFGVGVETRAPLHKSQTENRGQDQQEDQAPHTTTRRLVLKQILATAFGLRIQPEKRWSADLRAIAGTGRITEDRWITATRA